MADERLTAQEAWARSQLSSHAAPISHATQILVS